MYNTFENKIVSSDIIVDRIKDKDGNPLEKIAFGSYGVIVDTMTLTSNTHPVIGANSSGKMDFVVTLERSRNGNKMKGKILGPIVLEMDVVTGPGAVLTSCNYVNDGSRIRVPSSTGSVDNQGCLAESLIRVGNGTWTAGAGYGNHEVESNFKTVQIMLADGETITDTFETVPVVGARVELYHQSITCNNRISTKSRGAHINALRLGL